MGTHDEIRAWFLDRDDGCVGCPPQTAPYAIIGPTPSTRGVIYTTKPLCILSRDHSDDAMVGIALIGRGGLPTDDDVTWLRELTRGRVVCFLGDADPEDLLVFAWLRSRIDVRYAGVSDLLLSKMGVSWQDHVTISLSESESEAIPLLTRVYPEFRRLLGPKLSALLDNGRKLELEAVTVYPDVDARTLVEAVVSTAPCRSDRTNHGPLAP